MKDYSAIKEIVLTHFACDPLTGEVFKVTSSKRQRGGGKVGHVMKNGYICVVLPGLRLRVYAHHVVFFLVTGNWSPEAGVQIDHIDGHRANNRFNNLREATPMLNSCNRLQIASASPYQTKQGVRYRSRLNVGGVLYEKAGFNTPEDSKAWYEREKTIRSTELFGEAIGTQVGISPQHTHALVPGDTGNLHHG